MVRRLRGAFSPNTRVEPLIDGSVSAAGLEIDWERGSAGELHSKHLEAAGHDVFEFSISNYIVTRERFKDLWDWVLIPVFASKATLGLNTLICRDAQIESGADLAGKRFGIPDFTMTAGLWFRAQLAVLWGIEASQIEWFITRSPEESHGLQLGFDSDPPRGVDLQWARPGEAERMLASGELHAAFPSMDVPIDRNHPQIAPLFPDGGRTFMADFQERTGFLPVNHVVLIRREIAEREPWITESLFEAFEQAKRTAYERDRSAAGILRSGNDDMEWQSSVFGEDPYKYGLNANRSMLEMATRQSHKDGLTTDQWDLTELVAERLRDS